MQLSRSWPVGRTLSWVTEADRVEASDVRQRHWIDNAEKFVPELDQAAATEILQGTVQMHDRQTQRVGKVGLRQVEIVAVILSTLGVRRPGVTTTVHVLEGAGMIKARRSRIQILDRAKLEEAAGESYGVAEAEYRRLIGPGTPS